MESTARATTYLNGATERVRASASIDVHPVIIHGRVADRILDYALEDGTSLIVMTTHGWGPLSRAWFGSVTDHLMRTSPLPLLLVRPQVNEPDLLNFPVPPRIIIPLDGSPLAEQIVEPAVALGRLWGADYRLVRVVSPGNGDWDEEVRRQQDEAKQYLVQAWQKFEIGERPKSWNTRAVVMHDPASWILKYAHRHDVIALATRGLGGLDRLLLGSVADKLIRGAVGPVLVLSPHAAEQI